MARKLPSQIYSRKIGLCRSDHRHRRLLCGRTLSLQYLCWCIRYDRLSSSGWIPYLRRSFCRRVGEVGKNRTSEQSCGEVGDSETIVEVLPSSGRVLTINDVPTNAASFGVIRDIGTPPMLLGETYGNRRLSEHEKDEIRRLPELTRQRWTLGELIALVWFVPLTVLIALFFSSLRDEEPLWIVTILTILAAIPSCLVVWRRLDHRRLRRALRRALVEDAYVKTRNDEGRTIGVLKPDGLLCTLYNAPSPLRIRWRP